MKLHLAALLLLWTIMGPSESADTTPENYSLRLADGDREGSGRLEVYYNGQWYTICDDSFYHEEAANACGALGFATYGATEFDASGGDGPIALLDCNNVGSDVSSCTWSFGVQGWCNHYEDVGLNCSIPQDGDIRLSGNFTGRLEVFTNGEWSTVCSNLFGTEEANVACGDLGFAPEGATYYVAGDGSGPIAKATCDGTEATFLECLGPSDPNVCTHEDDVGIACQRMRLADGPNAADGRLEVFYGGQWNSVCANYNFGSNHAQSVCRELGFNPNGATYSIVGGDSRDMISLYYCYGDYYYDIFQCGIDTSVSSDDCTIGQDEVGVTCMPPAWIDVKTFDSVTYFLFVEPTYRIERFDMSSREWLDTINLPTSLGQPSVLQVDAESFFVAYSGLVYKYDLLGGSSTLIYDSPESVSAILLDDNIIFVVSSQSITSINRSRNFIIDVVSGDDYYYYLPLRNPLISTVLNRVIGFGYSGYLAYANYTKDGNVVGATYIYDAYIQGALWIAPDGIRVIDYSGKIYTVDDLSYSARLFSSDIQDIDWQEDGTPVVLDGEGTITGHDRNGFPSGSFGLEAVPRNIRVDNDQVLLFYPAHVFETSYSHGVRVDTLNLDDLSIGTPAPSINPNGLAFTPDTVFMDKDGVLHLYSGSHRNIFRWSPMSQEYLTSIPLVHNASYVAYSKVSHVIYAAHANGFIGKIDLNSENRVEEPFAVLLHPPTGLATAGDYLFAAIENGYHYTFFPNGTVSDASSNYDSSSLTDYNWCEANRQMYYMTSYDLAREGIGTDGQIGNGLRISTDYDDRGRPFRVSPDGSIIVIGSGSVYNETLYRDYLSLPNSVDDIAFLDGDGKDLNPRIYTVRNIAGYAQFQQWLEPSDADDSSYQLGEVLQVPGWSDSDDYWNRGPSKGYLLRLNCNTLVGIVVPDSTGVPKFHVMNKKLEILDVESTKPLKTTCGGFCFSGQSLVTKQDEGPILMRDLQIGDLVQVASSDKASADIIFEPVYSFAHSSPSVETSFLRIITVIGNSLELTADHLLFVQSRGYVAASTVKVGDVLVSISPSGAPEHDAVVGIMTVSRRGAYAPLTPSGTIFVNNVLASNYVALNDAATGKYSIGAQLGSMSMYHWVEHFALLPLRLVCHNLASCQAQAYDENGLAVWAVLPYRAARWFLKQHVISGLALLFLAVTGLGALMMEFFHYARRAMKLKSV